MFSRRMIAALSGVVGGLALASAGAVNAYAAAGPGLCSQDLQGNATCVQHIAGEIPEGGTIRHQESCAPVQPFTLPAITGSGSTRFGPEVTCAPPPPPAPAGAAEQGSSRLLS